VLETPVAGKKEKSFCMNFSRVVRTHLVNQSRCRDELLPGVFDSTAALAGLHRRTSPAFFLSVLAEAFRS